MSIQIEGRWTAGKARDSANGEDWPARVLFDPECGAHLSFWHPGCQLAAVLPHPNPLPLGEGAGSPALRPPERFLAAERRQLFSLSQRERAGVREHASITPERQRLRRRRRFGAALCSGLIGG